MPADIIETPTKGTTLSVPIGTEKRKASSLMAAWQAIGDRLKFLENWTDALFNAVTFPNSATWTIPDSASLVIRAAPSGTGQLDLSLLATIIFGGNVDGPLIRADEVSTGRVPKKINGGAPAISSDATFDPKSIDTVVCDPSSAAINLDLDNNTFVTGDHFRVVNLSTTAGHTITIRTAAHATLYTLDPASSSGHPCFVDMVYTSGFGWYVTAQNKVV